MRPPKFLDQVEAQIGLPFFSDPALGEQARIDPTQLPAEVVQPRAAVYLSGLHLVFGESSSALPDQEHQRRRTITTLRAELMDIDPGLETPLIKEFRVALGGLREQVKSRARGRTQEHHKPTDQLPAWRVPLQAIDGIVNGFESFRRSLKRQNIELPKFNLPGAQHSEVCFGWDVVRQLAREKGMRPGMDEIIELDKLPRSEDDGDKDRENYARHVQLQVVSHHKLQNIPELAPYLKLDFPEAKSYHVTRADLRSLMGGGYNFIYEYCYEHGIKTFELRVRGEPDRKNTVNTGSYMLIEDAAEIWDAYRQIPPATDDRVTIAWAAAEIKADKTFFRENLTDTEKALVEYMRAVKPKGRVLLHMPREAAQTAMDRLRRRTLPPYLISRKALEEYFVIGKSGITMAVNELGEETTSMRLLGLDQEQGCVTWGAVYRMQFERNVKLLHDDFQLDFSKLPRDETDLDPERIAYARYVQSLLVSHLEQVDQTPIEEYIAAQREKLGVTESDLTPKPSQWTELIAINTGLETGIRHRLEAPDSWQPVVDMETGGALTSGMGWIGANEIAFFVRISVDEVRSAIRRIDPGNTPPKFANYDPKEPTYSPDMLRAIRQQLAGVRLTEFQQKFKLTDQQLQNARTYLLHLNYPIFEGDICSPAAYQLLCDNAATFQ